MVRHKKVHCIDQLLWYAQFFIESIAHVSLCVINFGVESIHCVFFFKSS